MLDWINEKTAYYDENNFINEQDLYIIYKKGYPLQLVIFRTGKGLINISGEWTFSDFEKIAKINLPLESQMMEF